MNCDINCILDFFDGVMDFTKIHDSFKRVCENLESPDISWNSMHGRYFVQKFVEAKLELEKRCPIHGYEENDTDDDDDDDTDKDMNADMDEYEEESEEEDPEEEETAEEEDPEEEETAEEEESVDKGQCCCESLFQPMEPFYRNKTFRMLVQEEEDSLAESNPKFDNAMSNLRNIQPLIDKVTRNGVENLLSLDIKLIINLIMNFEYYTDKSEEELENFFNFNYSKLTDSDVSLNEKRKLMSKPHVKKKILRFLYIMQDWLNPNFSPMDESRSSPFKNQEGCGKKSIAKALHEQALDSTLNMTRDAVVGNDLLRY